MILMRASALCYKMAFVCVPGQWRQCVTDYCLSVAENRKRVMKGQTEGGVEGVAGGLNSLCLDRVYTEAWWHVFPTFEDINPHIITYFTTNRFCCCCCCCCRCVLDNIFNLDVHYICMLVQRFEPQGRRFTNFRYYYYVFWRLRNVRVFSELINMILMKRSFTVGPSSFYFLEWVWENWKWITMKSKIRKAESLELDKTCNTMF